MVSKLVTLIGGVFIAALTLGSSGCNGKLYIANQIPPDERRRIVEDQVEYNKRTGSESPVFDSLVLYKFN